MGNGERETGAGGYPLRLITSLSHRCGKMKTVTITKDSPVIGKILNVIQDKEADGYQYEAAEASLYILMRNEFLKEFGPGVVY